MGSNGAKHETLPNKATGVHVPKDDPDRVHTHALAIRNFIFSRGKKNLTQPVHSSSTYLKLQHSKEDRQKFHVPSFCGRYDGTSPVHGLLRFAFGIWVHAGSGSRARPRRTKSLPSTPMRMPPEALAARRRPAAHAPSHASAGVLAATDEVVVG